MPYFRCSECDSIFHSDEESRYVWCTSCGQPLDAMHEVPGLPSPETLGPLASLTKEPEQAVEVRLDHETHESAEELLSTENIGRATRASDR
jgi:hypothetical protein